MEEYNLDKYYEFLKFNKLKEAEEEINKLLLIYKNNYLLLNYLGNLFFSKRNIQAAIEKFKKSISINANYIQNYLDISLCFISLKKFNEVIFFLEEYIKYKNDNPDVYNNLGLALLEINKLDEAINYFNKCISLKIDYVLAYNNLGYALLKKKKINEAILILEQGIKIDNKFGKLYFNLAKCFIEKRQYFKAIKILKESLVNDTNNKEHLNLLGTCYLNIGQIEEGFIFINQSLNIKKDSEIYSIKMLHHFCRAEINFNDYFNDVEELTKIYNKVVKKDKNLEFISIKNPIKIGFVSADFREHAVSYQIFDVLRIFSKNKDFEIYVYNNDDNPDSITNSYKSFLSNWRDVKNFDDEKLINLIRHDNIKILVDLSGFTTGHRMSIFYNKAAPIQVTWCGYLASTGLKQIDYIIADKNILSSIDNKKYSEKVYTLNKTWTVLKPIYDIPVNEIVPAFKNKFISFASFNNLKKINSSVIELWSRILINIRNSKLYLFGDNFIDQDFLFYFKNLFKSYGVKDDQLIFNNSINRTNILNKYNSIDIALDTFPYSGGTTSLEAYWMCVPVLTKKGDYFISKSTESINRNVGLDDWVANNDDDYLAKAISFSQDLYKLQNIKDYLRKNRDKFIIFNSKDLAEELALAFSKMIRDIKNA